MDTALSEVLVFKLFRAETTTGTVTTPTVVIALDIIKHRHPHDFPADKVFAHGCIVPGESGRSSPQRQYHSRCLCLLRQLAFKAGNFSRLFALALRGGCLTLLLAAPGIELRLVKVEFTSGGGHTDAFSKFKGFLTKFRRVLLLSCELPLVESLLT